MKEKENKTTTIGIRVTPSVHAEISRLAREAGMSQSNFIVARALGRPVKNADHELQMLRRRVKELEGWTGIVSREESRAS